MKGRAVKAVFAARGFTLVELLAVVLLLGIVSVVAVVNFTRSDRTIVLDDARRMAVDLEAAYDLARFSGRAVALVVDGPDTYRFVQRDAQRHWAVAGESLALPRRLSAAVIASVAADGVEIKPGVPVVFRATRNGSLAIRLAFNEAAVSIRLSPLGVADIPGDGG